MVEPGPIDRAALAYQWYVGIDKVAGATGASFATNKSGIVSVEVFDDVGSGKAVTEVFLVTGTAPFVVPAPAPTATQVLVVGDAGNNTVDAKSLSIPVVLDGGAGDDSLYGGSGNDVLVAGDGAANLLDGGAGDKLFIAGQGNDTMIGGIGNGVFRLTFSQNVVTDAGGFDTLDASGVTFGITFNLTLTGPQIVAGTSSIDLTGNFERLIGTSGNDKLYGGDGADFLIAEAGAAISVLQGGSGGESLVALAPGVTLYGGDGGDGIAVVNGNSVAVAGGNGSIAPGGTALQSNSGNDTITGTASPTAVVVQSGGLAPRFR